MEYIKLEKLWNKYDSKLDNLEKIDKKQIKETLLKKPKGRLQLHFSNNIYGLISISAIFVLLMYISFNKENVDLKSIIGSVLAFLGLLYVIYANFKSILIINKIDLSENSLIQATTKIIALKKLYNKRWKHAIIYYPLVFLGVLLMNWDEIVFNSNSILVLVGLFLISYVAIVLGLRLSRNSIVILEKESENLKEYIE